MSAGSRDPRTVVFGRLWWVRAVEDGWTEATFVEEVRLGVRWPARFDRILGPVMRANHEVMRRARERGLQRLLVTKS